MLRPTPPKVLPSFHSLIWIHLTNIYRYHHLHLLIAMYARVTARLEFSLYQRMLISKTVIMLIDIYCLAANSIELQLLFAVIKIKWHFQLKHLCYLIEINWGLVFNINVKFRIYVTTRTIPVLSVNGRIELVNFYDMDHWSVNLSIEFDASIFPFPDSSWPHSAYLALGSVIKRQHTIVVAILSLDRCWHGVPRRAELSQLTHGIPVPRVHLGGVTASA
jgi:hypothetical protein